VKDKGVVPEKEILNPTTIETDFWHIKLYLYGKTTAGKALVTGNVTPKCNTDNTQT
jgi:hypothetical protein